MLGHRSLLELRTVLRGAPGVASCLSSLGQLRQPLEVHLSGRRFKKLLGLQQCDAPLERLPCLIGVGDIEELPHHVYETPGHHSHLGVALVGLQHHRGRPMPLLNRG